MPQWADTDGELISSGCDFGVAMNHLIVADECKGASAISIKLITVLVVFALTVLAPHLGYAEDKAPCGSFQKQPDGKWKVVSPVKIETDKGSGMLSPGTIIAPGRQIAGVDIFAALQRSCH